MKHGSDYARHVKRLYRQMLKQTGKPETPAPTDPIEQLIVAILSACTTDHKAVAVYRRLREQTVDLNELRVTPAVELAEMIGTGVPLAREKAHRIVDALNAVRRRQDKLDLSFLQQRRGARPAIISNRWRAWTRPRPHRWCCSALVGTRSPWTIWFCTCCGRKVWWTRRRPRRRYRPFWNTPYRPRKLRRSRCS